MLRTPEITQPSIHRSHNEKLFNAMGALTLSLLTPSVWALTAGGAFAEAVGETLNDMQVTLKE